MLFFYRTCLLHTVQKFPYIEFLTRTESHFLFKGLCWVKNQSTFVKNSIILPLNKIEQSIIMSRTSPVKKGQSERCLLFNPLQSVPHQKVLRWKQEIRYAPCMYPFNSVITIDLFSCSHLISLRTHFPDDVIFKRTRMVNVICRSSNKTFFLQI